MPDVPVIRRRLRQAIEQARRDAAARRAAIDQAHGDYERFLREAAEPVLRVLAQALTAEGHPFQIATPEGSIRLESARVREDGLELALDTTGDPVVIGRVSRGRGRRVIAVERPLREGAGVADLNEEDVLDFVLSEIGPFVER